MSASRYDICVERGATYKRTLTLHLDADKTNQRDLSGFTAKLQVRIGEDEDVLLELTETDGLTLGGSAGTIQLVISATRTSGFDQDLMAKYHLEISNSGEVERLLSGYFQTDEEIVK